MITIENKKTYKGDGFYIGRPSPLGNPFAIDCSTTREMAISKYSGWLFEMMKTDNPTSKTIRALVEVYKREGRITLICWCAPLKCHGEVIRELILRMSRGEQ